MLVIAIVGIRITARTQVGLGLIEYVILVAFAIAGLVAVLGHHHGTFAMTRVVERQRDRRAWQPRGRIPHCGVHVHRLGRLDICQRGDEAAKR